MAILPAGSVSSLELLLSNIQGFEAAKDGRLRRAQGTALMKTVTSLRHPKTLSGRYKSPQWACNNIANDSCRCLISCLQAD